MIHVKQGIIAFATQGFGSSDEQRLKELLSQFQCQWFEFNSKKKINSFLRLLLTLYREKPNLVVMEGSGSAGGLALILARLILGIPYVFSSGDAIAPFLSMRLPILAPLFFLYEWVLCRLSSGFIGWTPYLVGRAMTLGAPRGMSAAGWAPKRSGSTAAPVENCKQVRLQLGIPQDAIVIGIVGSLNWNIRTQYCYGYELVQAAALCKNPNIRFLIVGGGTGLDHLQRLAKSHRSESVIFSGRVDRERIPAFLHAMDIASLPQSLDLVGSLRYTTKLSEYSHARLPIVVGQIPLAYDLGMDWVWRLPGKFPWDQTYIQALARLLDQITPEQIHEKKEKLPSFLMQFDHSAQVRSVTDFIQEIIQALEARR